MHTLLLPDDQRDHFFLRLVCVASLLDRVA
jgi:hypothetical protein